jgi:hypothetical protein
MPIFILAPTRQADFHCEDKGIKGMRNAFSEGFRL